jgi:hypothetical protein
LKITSVDSLSCLSLINIDDFNCDFNDDVYDVFEKKLPALGIGYGSRMRRRALDRCCKHSVVLRKVSGLHCMAVVRRGDFNFCFRTLKPQGQNYNHPLVVNMSVYMNNTESRVLIRSSKLNARNIVLIVSCYCFSSFMPYFSRVE